MSSLAYCLIEMIRRRALAGTELARAQRQAPSALNLLRIGNIVTRNIRRVRLHLSSACPDQALFLLAAVRLKLG